MNDCVFCKIIKGEIPGKFVHRDEHIVVFHDIAPKAPVHVLVVPIQHTESLRNVEESDEALLGKMMWSIRLVSEQLGIAEGFKVIINNGPASGQLVFHLHAHVLGGWKTKKTWEI